MTEKLFYLDSHLQEFTAKVISCEKSSRGYEAVLDRTAFFPEGGGQASDIGNIDGVKVLHVSEKKGMIYHLMESELKAGDMVHGKIDWDKRFERMQQHSGEHIVSGLIHSRFGYDNVGFHLGEEVCTLDMSGPITKEELMEIENEANKVVFSNVIVETLYPSKEELSKMEYRSKIDIEGQVRIVKIDQYDICACCAPHVKTTGEIGLVKFIHCQNYKGGVRITMVCGHRALKDYQKKDQSIKSLMASLCSKEELVVESVERMKDENAHLKNQLHNLQREIITYKLASVQSSPRVCMFEQLDGNLPREMMNQVLSKNVDICAVFSGTDEMGYRYVIGSAKCDVRPIAKSLNDAFNGRGGGKPEMVQGSLKGQMDKIRSVFMES